MHSNEAHNAHHELPTHQPVSMPAEAFRPVPALLASRAFEGSALEDHFFEDTLPLPAYRPERLW